MRHRRSVAVIAWLLTLGIDRTARAQSPTPNDAATALRTLIALGQESQDLLTPVVFNLIKTEIATIPTASSSAGFTYNFDQQLGIPVLSTKSFGPLFVERPNTAGRGRVALSLDFQHTNWRSLDGLDLKGGGLHSQEGNGGFSQALIDLRSSISVIGVTIGVSDRIDVGASVPLITTSVSGHYTSFNGHFAGSVQGTSRGLGDVTVRSKVRLLDAPQFGLAAAVEGRIPTGDANKLLGVGKAQVRLLLVAAEHGEKVSHHLNLGYTFGGAGAPPSNGFGFPDFAQHPLEPSDEINYSGGVDVAAGSRVTVSGDLIGRVLRNTVQILSITNGSAIFMQFVNQNRRTFLLGVAGVKVNVGGQWLVRANVLFPMTDNGLEPGITPVIGLERAF